MPVDQSYDFDSRLLEAKVTRMTPTGVIRQKRNSSTLQIHFGARTSKPGDAKMTPLLTKHLPFQPVRAEEYLQQID